jgi:hypothetical protein
MQHPIRKHSVAYESYRSISDAVCCHTFAAYSDFAVADMYCVATRLLLTVILKWRICTLLETPVFGMCEVLKRYTSCSKEC